MIDMKTSTVLIIVITAVVMMGVIVACGRSKKKVPPHLQDMFGSYAEYEAFLDKQKELNKLSKEYFTDGSKPNKEDILKLFKSIAGEAATSQYEKAMRPCIRLEKKQNKDKPSNSRIGGLPSLEKMGDWPKKNSKSLAFIAQIDLSDLQGESKLKDLPDSGVLCFFYDAMQETWGFDPKDKGGWAVVHVEDPVGTKGIRFPDDLPKDAQYPEVPVVLNPAPSAPDPDVALNGLNLTEEQRFQLSDIYYQFIEKQGLGHQLLGYSANIQGDMKLECQLASNGLYCGDPSGYKDPRAKELEKGAEDWQLLLQIDSDDDAGMMWGDSGRLYYWITMDDLKNKRFEKSWLILQCY